MVMGMRRWVEAGGRMTLKLLRHLVPRSIPGQKYRLRWRTESGRMRQGFDLDSRERLFDQMGHRQPE